MLLLQGHTILKDKNMVTFALGKIVLQHEKHTSIAN